MSSLAAGDSPSPRSEHNRAPSIRPGNVSRPPTALFSKLGVFVADDFLTAQECRQVSADMAAGTEEMATLAKPEGDRLDEAVRRSRQVSPTGPAKRLLAERFRSLLPGLAQYFQVELIRDQGPQFLLYREGDFFVPHFDGHSEKSEADAARVRRVSAVAFLNDAQSETDPFDGGDLVLYGLIDQPVWREVGMAFPAKAGTLVAFRSDLWHEVTPVLKGLRYSVVTWYE